MYFLFLPVSSSSSFHEFSQLRKTEIILENCTCNFEGNNQYMINIFTIISLTTPPASLLHEDNGEQGGL